MSSRSETDPADMTPEERQADWKQRMLIRERIKHGGQMFGPDRFHAFLTLPDVDIESDTLHDDFICRYNGSYHTIQRALEGFVDCAPLAVVLRYYVRVNEGTASGIVLNYEAVTVDFERMMRAVEMGGRIHVFWRADTDDE